MSSRINVKNKNNVRIRKISINGKSKQIKKNTTFFGRFLGKFSIFKFPYRNRTKLIENKNQEIQKKMEKDTEIENSIKKKNVSPQDANTIFSFFSHENKKNVNNKNEFLDVLKTVESSINNNLLLRKSETKKEKIKRTFLNLLDTSKSFISFGNNNNNDNCSSASSKSDTSISDNEKILPSDIEISEHSDDDSNAENSEVIESTDNKIEIINEKIHESPQNNFHFWRSNTNPIDSDDENSLKNNDETDKDVNKITENNDIDSSSVTTSTDIISPNRVLLSESYYQSKQPRKFNSLNNLYFKNSNKQLSKYFTDVTMKYDQKSSYDAYKASASKYLNKKHKSASFDQNIYKDLLSNTKQVYQPSTFVIPKQEKEKTKKKIKNTGLDDQWVEDIRKKIENSLILNEQIKLNEPQKDYYEELLKFGKLIEEEALKKKENKNFPELSEEAYEDIEEAIGPGRDDEILIEEFNIPIKRHDIRTLINGEWLNDEIINFYGNLIMERSKNTTNKYPTVYFFNTFFFSTLCETGYRAVRRWTRKFDLFLYDFVIIPIHLGNHWCCSAINFKKKRFEYYDSLHGGDRNALNILRNYIQEESKDKKKVEYNFTGWENYCPKDIPSQLNGYDCGVFTLLFAEYISREEEFDFDQSHIEYVRNRIIYEIINKELLIV